MKADGPIHCHGKQKLAVAEDLEGLLEVLYDIVSIGGIETLVVG